MDELTASLAKYPKKLELANAMPEGVEKTARLEQLTTKQVAKQAKLATATATLAAFGA